MGLNGWMMKENEGLAPILYEVTLDRRRAGARHNGGAVVRCVAFRKELEPLFVPYRSACDVRAGVRVDCDKRQIPSARMEPVAAGEVTPVNREIRDWALEGLMQKGRKNC